MKIAILHFGRHGAGPVYSLEMAKALSGACHDVIYYGAANAENRRAVEKEKFVSKFYETYDSKLSYLVSIIFRHTIKQIIKDIQKEKPDYIYSPMNDLWTPFLFGKLSDFVRIKTIHDVGIHEGNDSFFNIYWNNSQFKDAEKYVILSRGFLPVLTRKGININNVQVIPHAGFDYYTSIGDSTSDNCINASNSLLFFGRIEKYKGLRVLLSAMEAVIKKNPNIMLSIVGNGDMSDCRDLFERVKSNLIVRNEWIPDEDVAGIMKSASCVILPYTHATQSGVIPLAYAFSKPVIATNVGCLGEQVLDGKTGFLIEKCAPQLIADAILEMFADAENMKQMGLFANKYMKENLTWEASAQKLVDFINKR